MFVKLVVQKSCGTDMRQYVNFCRTWMTCCALARSGSHDAALSGTSRKVRVAE